MHLQDFPYTPSIWLDSHLHGQILGLRAVRRVVTAAIEVERREKRIGASLEAAPVVYLPKNFLGYVPDAAFLAELCITSSIMISHQEPPEFAFKLSDIPHVAVAFARAEGAKCQRCWKILPDVGTHAHPGVCGRCSDALAALPATAGVDV